MSEFWALAYERQPTLIESAVEHSEFLDEMMTRDVPGHFWEIVLVAPS